MEILIYVAIGITIGCLSGVLGIGGGVLIIPALIWFCGFAPSEARGTSLAILIPPIGLPAAIKYYHDGKVILAAAVWIACAFALGALVGAYVVRYFDELLLRLIFGLIMVYIAFRVMISSDNEVAVAAAGLTATFLAWIGYLGLRALGRRHMKPPDLGDQIRAMQEQGRGESDYHI
jgi:uncharacterized membrane protein YfcA